MTEKRAFVIGFFILIFSFTFVISIFSHCQVPCGIYDDPMRIRMIKEHITTIEKAMKQILAISKKSPVNFNQIVRWVNNKEKHAEELSGILTYYFMAQRVKWISDSETKLHSVYLKKLELLHQLLVFTMKAKQSADLSVIKKLRWLTGEFEKVYFSSK